MNIKFLIIIIFVAIFLSSNYSSHAGLNPLLESSVKYDRVQVERADEVGILVLTSGERVSLIGLSSPPKPSYQSVKRDKHGFIILQEDPTTSLEVEALRFVNDLVQGNVVRLEFDVQRRDDQGFLLVYIFLPDGKLLNEEILLNGYARLQLAVPNMKYADRFRAAYQVARHEMRGIQGQW